MKKTIGLFAFLIVTLFAISCNDDKGAEVTDIYYKKIDSVAIPKDSMSLSELQNLKLYSTFTKNCEGFYNVSYNYDDDFTRSVVNLAFKTNETCGDGNYVAANTINFQPIRKGVYTIRFWNGTNDNKENIWIEKKIVVN